MLFSIRWSICCCLVAKLCLTLCDPKDCNIPGFSVLHCLPEFAQIHVHWVDDAILTISSSAAPFSFCLQSFPASGSSPMSQLFASSGQSIGASALASVLPMNIYGWFPLILTGFTSLQSKGLLRVFFSITIWKHQFLIAQLVKNPPAMQEIPSSIPGSGRSAGERMGYPTPVFLGFPGGSVGKESSCSVGDLGLIRGLGRSPGEENGYPLQYSGLENSMDYRGHRVGHDWVTFTSLSLWSNSHIHTWLLEKP